MTCREQRFAAGYAIRPRLITLSILLCFLLCPFCASGGSTLTIGVGRDLYEGPESETYIHGSTNVWEALTILDGNLEPAGWLAESWRMQDGGRTWVFRLHRGVRFHNGSLLTAAHVVANMERRMKHRRFDPRGDLREVISVKAKGELNVVFRLKRPLPFFPALMAYYGSPIFHPGVFDAKGRITRPVGTGPFRLGKVKPGETIELFAFDGYRGKKPAFQRVMIRDIPDAQTRVFALIRGEIDAIIDVGGILPSQINELKAGRDIELKRAQLAMTHYLMMNCRRPPFDNVGARLWLAGRIDRKRLVDKLMEGTGIVAGEFYSPLARKWAPHDRALRSAPEAKKPAPLPKIPIVILLHSNFQQRLPYDLIAQVIAQTLREEGFEPRIEIKETGAFQEALKKGEFHLSIQPRNLLTGDPDFYYSSNISSSSFRNTGFTDPEADRLIDLARHETGQQKRRRIYDRLASIMAANMPMIPLYHEVALYAHRKDVEGLTMDAVFRPDLAAARPSGGSVR
ncbi:MAG TPA: ABC transporter substrate-binding protein [Syntrophorhabdaceae bacterium]|nr:ABC transporter substrate-binding protein [Syntrophorhabdaceae bacterium]